MTGITSTTNRGFASFDLSTIPAGSIINSVTLSFTTFSSTSSTATNNIYGFTGDPSAIAGATLYTNAGSGTSFNNTSWTANAANSKALNAAGIAFIQNNAAQSFVNLGFVRGSSNSYSIYGYPGTAVQQPALTIDYTPPVACNGPISPITIASGTTNACVSTPFNITSSGVAPGTSGVSYQWQTSAQNANVFGDVAASGTAATLAISSQTSATDYRLRVICTNTSDTTYSNILQIGQNPFYNCYCVPISGCTNEGIDSVGIGTFSNTSGSCANTSGYSNYESLGSVISVNQGDLLPVTVKAKINSNPASAGLWIDFNHDGLFDAMEYVSLGSATVTIPSGGTPYIFSANVLIDASSLTGITRMRIRSANQNGIANTSSCITSSAFGEFEDYLITINPGVACSGTPNAGSITTAPASVCPSTNFTLAVTGFTSGVVGLSYQWQYYNTATTTWDPAPGTNNTFTYTGNITSQTDFRFAITCGANTGTTTPMTINVNPVTQCYCTPATTSSTYFINNFSTTNGISDITNANSGYSTAGYGNFTGTQTVSVLENGSFNFSGNYGSSSTYTFGTKVWVDWNQNGLFTDAGEQMFATTGYGTSFSGTITVPVGALTGNTRMRVGSNYNSGTGPTTPCLNFANGEYEDYTVNVIALIPCSGTPTPGTASAPAQVCPNAPLTLQAVGYTTGTGLSLQWEESQSGVGSWSPISGATTATYTITTGIANPMDYRLKITCSNGGGNDVSNTVTVGINPFFNCYCTPASGCVNEGIENVTFDALNNNSTFCTNTSGYSDFSGLGALATVVQAQTVAISVTGRINSNPASVGVWIDYDHSGTFDTTEYTLIGTSTGISPLPTPYIYSGNIVIDPTAQTGITRMRVRQANQGGIAKTSACTNTGVFGEYEDYLININASNNCSGTPTAGTVVAPGSVCPGIQFSLSATGTTNGVLGLTYEWQYYNTATTTWDPAPGTNNNATYTATSGITTTTDYRLKITCTNGGGFDISSPVSIFISPVVSCYCIPGGNNSSYYINNLSTTGGTKNITKTATNYSPSGYGDFTATDTLEVQAGTVFNLNAAFGSGASTFGVKIWIDYDGDGSFAQAGEQVYVSSQYYNTFATPITIPATTAAITTRMRIGISFTPNSGPSGPCAVIAGEFEDYTISILAAPSCLASTSFTPSAQGSSFATLSWNSVATAAGYEYIVDQVATSPTVAGVNTTDTFYNATGLTPASIYYLHVRTNCGSSYSPWANFSFFTTAVNDSCTNALPVPWTGQIPGDNLYATNDALPAVTCGSTTATTGTYHGLWYTITPVGSGSMTVGVCTNNFDTYMRIYEGTCGNFTACAGSDDDGCPSNTGSIITFNAVANTTYYVLVGTYGSGSSPNNGTFTLEVTGVPLAIDLKSIVASNVGDRNRIDFSTASETKGDYFEMERSVDGREFTKIAAIAAKGTASNYTYWDETPVNGINYYRLKMVDAAGNFNYSRTVSATAKISGVFAVQAYPNPVSEILTVVARGTKTEKATLLISDITGKIIRTVNMENGFVTIDMRGLAQGFYLVKYNDGTNTQTIKVNKQ